MTCVRIPSGELGSHCMGAVTCVHCVQWWICESRQCFGVPQVEWEGLVEVNTQLVMDGGNVF